jgi:ribonucleoside-diphosphate reductase subunit M1
VPTPTTTPPPAYEKENKKPAASPVKAPTFKADADEGESPKALATEPASKPPKAEELPAPAVATKKQEEDKTDESADREHDIYAEAVLQCKFLPPNTIPVLTISTGSIDNKDECLMCSG